MWALQSSQEVAFRWHLVGARYFFSRHFKCINSFCPLNSLWRRSSIIVLISICGGWGTKRLSHCPQGRASRRRHLALELTHLAAMPDWFCTHTWSVQQDYKLFMDKASAHSPCGTHTASQAQSWEEPQVTRVDTSKVNCRVELNLLNDWKNTAASYCYILLLYCN